MFNQINAGNSARVQYSSGKKIVQSNCSNSFVHVLKRNLNKHEKKVACALKFLWYQYLNKFHAAIEKQGQKFSFYGGVKRCQNVTGFPACAKACAQWVWPLQCSTSCPNFTSPFAIQCPLTLSFKKRVATIISLSLDIENAKDWLNIGSLLLYFISVCFFLFLSHCGSSAKTTYESKKNKFES